MNRRNLLGLSALTALGFAMLLGNAVAQQAADVEGVEAASRAFYAALAVIDDGTAMEAVWAHTPYVTYVGPTGKSIIVGWDAQKRYWAESNRLFAQRPVALTDQHIHVNGNLAWELGQETGDAKLKDGAPFKVDFIVTNVYEKLDGRWLIVSHHVQPKPQ